MSAFRGIATGFLQAKIRNTEANDALKANTLARVGETLIGETIPNAVEAEKVRRTNYDMLSSEFTPNFAEVADKSGFTLNDDTMKVLREKLKEGNLDKKALENANFQTDFNTRYNQRAETAEEKYSPILKQLGIDGIGSLGYNTVEALVKPTTTTAKDTMTDAVTQTPIKFDSMQLGDYLTPMSGKYQVDAKKFAAAAQPFGFQGSIKFDPASGEPIFTLPGTQNTQYRALFALTNDYSSQFLDQDKKVNISQAVEFANKKLYQQTQGIISTVANDYKQSSSKGVVESTAQGFTNNFNKDYPTDADKKEAFKNHLISLGTKSEQEYFAESFPVGVTFSDGKTEVKKYLLNLTNKLK